jgi:ubiquitin-protein ligase
MTVVEFACQKCGGRLRAPAAAVGRTGHCKRCGEANTVPTASINHKTRIGLSTAQAKSHEAPQSLPEPGTPAAASMQPDLAEKSDGRATMAPELRAGTAVKAVPQEPEAPVRSQAIAEPPPLVATPIIPRTRIPVRTRRLLADAQLVNDVLGACDLIQLDATVGNPPEVYRIRYAVHSLARGPGGAPVARHEHLVEIRLTHDYPRQSPQCKMLTPVFHPNIEPATICIGDHWTAGERLIDLIVRIGEMIAYQTFNIKSPLDGEAAMWADLNRHLLPTDPRDLLAPRMV